MGFNPLMLVHETIEHHLQKRRNNLKRIKMSLLSENIIPGNHGKTFGTNAENHEDLLKIKDAISQMEGIKGVLVHEDKFPKEFTIHTKSMVSVKEIEDTVIKTGFHAIPKSLFEL